MSNLNKDDYGHYARPLSKLEFDKIISEDLITDFNRDKLEKDAKKNWDLFYKRNSVNFFKDRHWTKHEFDEFNNLNSVNQIYKPSLLELGCGVGNFIFPLIEEKINYFVYGCDFSPRAIEFVKNNPLYNEDHCKVFVSDITNETFIDEFKKVSNNNLVDLISLIFVLSAISPDKMEKVFKNCYDVLKPGGKLIFRDYGLYDHAMLRFKEGKKISDNFYVRIDGTRAFYFSEEYVEKLAKTANFEILENKYVKKETVNKKEGINVPRIFIQSKFYKPI